MEDHQIIDLYFARSERAISETNEKYGHLCYSIALNVLHNREDAQESVNDTYLALWNAIPPQRPDALMAFLAKITRRISIKRWRSLTAHKRGGGEVPLVLEELSECVSNGMNVEETAINQETCAALNRFLDALPEIERMVFLRRYFLMDSAAAIGENFGFTESKVNSMLFRTRRNLKKHLKKEGYV